MKKIIVLLILLSLATFLQYQNNTQDVLSQAIVNKSFIEESNENYEYWFLLKRKSNIEILYHGKPGNAQESKIIKTFIVKTGENNVTPTPLHKLIGRDYWLITDKYKIQSEDIGPYFLKLDIPYKDRPPYGPEPYKECKGQCNWQIPGSFGLHGVSGDNSRLAKTNKGSSGCVRHFDEDITYIYNLIDPKNKPVKYYIKDI